MMLSFCKRNIVQKDGDAYRERERERDQEKKKKKKKEEEEEEEAPVSRKAMLKVALAFPAFRQESTIRYNTVSL